jgi:ribosome maturation factor RimP
VALQDIVGQSVAGLGYEVVDIERSTAVLRVTIDWPWIPGTERFINVEDCEKVTRQLRFALEVEGIEYRRLEVSSPGIDRPLRTPGDFERFEGETIDLTLRQPIGAQSQGQVNAQRKKFRGRLERGPQLAGSPSQAGTAAQWRLVWSEEPTLKAGTKPDRRPARAGPQAPLQAMTFGLDEMKEARLAPIVDFKGRKPRGTPSAG